jgi:hypothetical protein
MLTKEKNTTLYKISVRRTTNALLNICTDMPYIRHIRTNMCDVKY